MVEALRYGLYHQDRATTVDASPDHADLFSRIHGLFEQPGSEVRHRFQAARTLTPVLSHAGLS